MLKKTILLLSIFNFNSLVYAKNFQEVDEGRTSIEFVSYIEDALSYLKHHPRKIGQLTYQSIVDGRVKVDLLKDLTKEDFGRVLEDYRREDSLILYTIDDYEDFRKGDSDLLAYIESGIDGYMWEDRIYIHHLHTTKKLGATLVHEVNHVLNRSEVNYYDSPLNALTEEYRAFLAEAMLGNKSIWSKRHQRRILKRTIDLYGFPKKFQKKFKRLPKGHYLPTEENWSRNWQ